MVEPTPPTPLTRRRFLVLGGSLTAGAVVLSACSDGDDDDAGGTEARADTGDASTSTTAGDTTTTAAPTDTAVPTTGADATTTTAASDLASGTPADTVFTAADFAALGTCRLLPELTQGPFPTLEQIERRDITEGGSGSPLRLGIQVVDAACAPVPGAVVEVWHCDVDGDYSAYADGYTDDDAGEGTTFLRGSQVANGEGIVEFHTVHPGWYQGRAVHIHAKVHLDDATVLTTQFLFDDALNDEVLATGVYAEHGSPDTTNADDGVTGGSGEADGLLLAVADDAAIAGRRGLIVVGVDPDATSSGGAGGPGGTLPPGGGRPGGPGGPVTTP